MIRPRTIWSLLIGVLLIPPIAFWAAPCYKSYLYDVMSQACSDNNFPRVQHLFWLGADPLGAGDCNTSLMSQPHEFTSHVMVATSHPDCRILRYLLSKGAAPDMSEGDGTTPLAMAVNNHNVEAVKLLLAAGANPNYKTNWTAADQAKALGFSDIVDIVKPYLRP